jgi:energy-converting hydrogenase Eha subunit A
MRSKPNNRLIVKVIIIGIAVAVSSYLFHPEAGQFSVTSNGQPIADPLIQFAAIPTFLVFIGLTVILTALLFVLGCRLIDVSGNQFCCIIGLRPDSTLLLSCAADYFSDDCDNVTKPYLKKPK